MGLNKDLESNFSILINGIPAFLSNLFALNLIGFKNLADLQVLGEFCALQPQILAAALPAKPDKSEHVVKRMAGRAIK